MQPLALRTPFLPRAGIRTLAPEAGIHASFAVETWRTVTEGTGAGYRAPLSLATSFPPRAGIRALVPEGGIRASFTTVLADLVQVPALPLVFALESFSFSTSTTGTWVPSAATVAARRHSPLLANCSLVTAVSKTVALLPLAVVRVGRRRGLCLPAR